MGWGVDFMRFGFCELCVSLRWVGMTTDIVFVDWTIIAGCCISQTSWFMGMCSSEGQRLSGLDWSLVCVLFRVYLWLVDLVIYLRNKDNSRSCFVERFVGVNPTLKVGSLISRSGWGYVLRARRFVSLSCYRNVLVFDWKAVWESIVCVDCPLFESQLFECQLTVRPWLSVDGPCFENRAVCDRLSGLRASALVRWSLFAKSENRYFLHTDVYFRLMAGTGAKGSLGKERIHDFSSPGFVSSTAVFLRWNKCSESKCSGWMVSTWGFWLLSWRTKTLNLLQFSYGFYTQPLKVM